MGHLKADGLLIEAVIDASLAARGEVERGSQSALQA